MKMELTEAVKRLQGAGFLVEGRAATVYDGFTPDELNAMRAKRAAAKEKRNRAKAIIAAASEKLEGLGEKIVARLNDVFNIHDESQSNFYYECYSGSDTPTSIDDFTLYINSPGASEATAEIRTLEDGYKINTKYVNDDGDEIDGPETTEADDDAVINALVEIMVQLDGEEYNVK